MKVVVEKKRGIKMPLNFGNDVDGSSRILLNEPRGSTALVGFLLPLSSILSISLNDVCNLTCV